MRKFINVLGWIVFSIFVGGLVVNEFTDPDSSSSVEAAQAITIEDLTPSEYCEILAGFYVGSIANEFGHKGNVRLENGQSVDAFEVPISRFAIGREVMELFDALAATSKHYSRYYTQLELSQGKGGYRWNSKTAASLSPMILGTGKFNERQLDACVYQYVIPLVSASEGRYTTACTVFSFLNDKEFTNTRSFKFMECSSSGEKELKTWLVENDVEVQQSFEYEKWQPE